MKNINLFLITCIFFFLTSCRLDKNLAPDNRLPRITTSGENTIGCLINGELWIPKVEGGGANDFNFSFQFMDTTQTNLFIQVHTRKISGDNSISDWLDFYIEDYDIPREYYLKSGWVDFSTVDCGDYSNIKSLNSKVEILRLSSGIIAGTFEFLLINEEGEDCEGDTLVVTEGRFDLKN